MLSWALTFLIIALIAAVFGFGGIYALMSLGSLMPCNWNSALFIR